MTAAKFEIEKFNGSNFSLWKLKIKAILRKDNCLAAISEKWADFTDDNKWNEIDEIANLHLALANRVLSGIEENKTVKKIWDHLTNCTRPSHFTTRFSSKGNYIHYGCLNLLLR